MTGSIAVAPLWVGIWVSDGNPLLSIVVSMLMALALGRIGAALWQRTEASEDLVFDDHEHVPLATLPGMFERTLSLSSAGK